MSDPYLWLTDAQFARLQPLLPNKPWGVPLKAKPTTPHGTSMTHISNVPTYRRHRRMGRTRRSGLGITVWAVLAGVLLLWVGLGQAQPGDTLSPAAQQSIADILKAKSQRTPAQRKLSSQLLDAAARQPAPAAGIQAGQTRSTGDQDTMVTVDIRADVTEAVLERIRALGGTVVNSVPEYRAIRARLPLTALETLAELDAVQSIRPADRPFTHQMRDHAAVARAVVRAAGSTNTEGDRAHQADAARQTYQVDGTGIGIGVISDGIGETPNVQNMVVNLPAQISGDLPAQVEVLDGQEGGPFPTCTGQSSGVEGAAMLEIVHDLAPGADLFFATAGPTPAQMAMNIKNLCKKGKVIVDDIGWVGAPVFQEGVIAQAISEVVADGCYYFTAAGNGGNKNDGTSSVWEGDFTAGPALALSGLSTGAVVHDFGGGVTGNTITRDLPIAGQPHRSHSPYIVLQWADPVGQSANDYDLFVIDANNTVLKSSTDTQDGDDEPIEIIGECINWTNARLVIVKNAGAATRYLRLGYLGAELAIATAGQTFGHSAAQDAIGVAAVEARTAGGAGGDFDGTESVERFSSDGPRRIFFEADGTALTSGDFTTAGGQVGLTLQKPDVTAADGVSTSTPGFSRFFGTSAAAPHAAGIAALMLQAGGGPARVTPDTLREAMTESALDIEAPGVDRDSGAGIVMALAAIGALTADRHGNTPAQATRIRLGGTAPWASSTAGQINTADDSDYFTLRLPQAGVLVVETTGRTDTVGTVWQAGEEVARAASGGERRNFRLSVRVQAGPVVVAVEGNGRRTGPYHLETALLVGYLENPGRESFQSGVRVLSGWVCTAEAVEIEVETEHGAVERYAASYGTERLDTAPDCGDTDNGFGLLFNWNRLGDGEHSVVALVDGVELGRATVTVTTLGQEFVEDAVGMCVVEDFPDPGQQVTLEWQQNQQNFVIASGRRPRGAYRAGTVGVGYLGNPGGNSFQSGIGVISGWVCDAETVVIEIETEHGAVERYAASYGTERLDTAPHCGDTDNGFGLLFNWNRLGDGEHTVSAWVDGVELGRAVVRVTTVGEGAEEEFLPDAAGMCVVEDFPDPGQQVTLEWQQSSQNFVITGVE